jgi:hypothetical protein
MPKRALHERLDGKLYRRNPVVISMTAYGEIQRACHQAMVRWSAAQSAEHVPHGPPPRDLQARP